MTKEQALAIAQQELENRGTREKIALGVLATACIGFGIYKGLGATTVVAGSTAVAGAIKTTTVMTASGPMVLSLVKASVATQILTGVLSAVLLGVVVYGVYSIVKRTSNEETELEEQTV